MGRLSAGKGFNSIPGGVHGIIGGALMLTGALTYTSELLNVMEAVDTGEAYIADYSLYYRAVAAVFPYFISGILGLIGGIKTVINNNRTGAVLIFLSAACALAVGILALAPLGFISLAISVIGGILAIVISKPKYSGKRRQSDGYGGTPPASYDPMTGKPVGGYGRNFDPYSGEPADKRKMNYDPHTGKPLYGYTPTWPKPGEQPAGAKPESESSAEPAAAADEQAEEKDGENAE